MKTVYVVIGSYEDCPCGMRREWSVCAYFDEVQANSHAKKAADFVRSDRMEPNPYDPIGWRDSTDYDVYEVEIREDVPE